MVVIVGVGGAMAFMYGTVGFVSVAVCLCAGPFAISSIGVNPPQGSHIWFLVLLPSRPAYMFRYILRGTHRPYMYCKRRHTHTSTYYMQQRCPSTEFQKINTGNKDHFGTLRVFAFSPQKTISEGPIMVFLRMVDLRFGYSAFT